MGVSASMTVVCRWYANHLLVGLFDFIFAG
jgi:hypothetical protein